MKTNKESWEEKLKKQLGDDTNRFPLPENYFDSLKNEIQDKFKDEVKASAFPEASADEQTLGHPGLEAEAFSAKTSLAEGPEPVTPNPKPLSKPLLKWVYIAALPIAAALAFFVLNRETVPQPETLDQTSMSDAAEGFYESRVEEAFVLEIDSETIAGLQENEVLESMKEEVLIEEYELAALEEEENEDNPFAELDLEDIEQYLAENININSEL